MNRFTRNVSEATFVMYIIYMCKQTKMVCFRFPVGTLLIPPTQNISKGHFWLSFRFFKDFCYKMDVRFHVLLIYGCSLMAGIITWRFRYIRPFFVCLLNSQFTSIRFYLLKDLAYSIFGIYTSQLSLTLLVAYTKLHNKPRFLSSDALSR